VRKVAQGLSPCQLLAKLLRPVEEHLRLKTFWFTRVWRTEYSNDGYPAETPISGTNKRLKRRSLAIQFVILALERQVLTHLTLQTNLHAQHSTQTVKQHRPFRGKSVSRPYMMLRDSCEPQSVDHRSSTILRSETVVTAQAMEGRAEIKSRFRSHYQSNPYTHVIRLQ